MADGSIDPIRLLPVMKPFRTQRRRHKVARGGRGGGKSWCIARLLLLMGIDSKLRILCAREIQKSIRDSVHKLLADQIEVMGLSYFYDVQSTTIKGLNGTEFLFTGLQDHTSQSIKSYEGCDICWIEEAARVSGHSANILIPTIRKAGSELWWSYNPEQEDDFVHANIARRQDSLVIDVSFRDNPWFPAELEQERLALKALNDDLYQHIWEGKCRSTAGLLFKRKWFKRFKLGEQPENLSLYMSSDYAGAPDAESEREPDNTEHGIFGLDSTGDLWITDWWYEQADPEVWINAAAQLLRRHKPLAWFEEKGVILRALDSSITKRLRELDTWVFRRELASAGSKADRALGFAARASKGAVHIPDCEWGERLVNQLCAFTGEDGRPDDAVDVCSLLARGLDVMTNARPPQDEVKKEVVPFTRSWFERTGDVDHSEEERRRFYR